MTETANTADKKLGEVDKTYLQFQVIAETFKKLLPVLNTLDQESIFLYVTYDEIHISPRADSETEKALIARKVRGAVERSGYIGKTHKNTYSQDESMDFIVLLPQATRIKVSSYMPKTCRIVTEQIKIEEIKEHTVAYQPARTETRTRIVCEDG